MATSYFFTELSFNQVATGTNPDKAFGPLDENKFQITTTFKGALNAYASVKGTLLIARQKGTTDKINVILKPTGNVGLGIKIKYFVYRGISASDYLKNIGGIDYLNNASPLNFIVNAWNAYTQLHQITGDLEVSKIGLIDSSTPINTDIHNFFFKKGNDQLLQIEAGKLLGKFVTDSGGFEIILDEGDYSQSFSDTGLDFNSDFATARNTMLNFNSTTINEFGGKTSKYNALDVKIFRENIYRFIDPAAYYGLHLANTVSGTKAKIETSTGTLDQLGTIYSSIISKFINRNKIYIYVRGERGRSYNFYKPDAERTIKYFGGDVPFNTSKWPLLIKDVFSKDAALGFNFNVNNIVESNILLKEVSAEPRANSFFFNKIGSFKLILPFTNDNKNVSVGVFLNYFDGENEINNLFGNVNIATIFEKEDFTFGSKPTSYVNNLRSVLIRDGLENSKYCMKLLLTGNYISVTNPDPADPTNPTNPPSAAILAENLRTYILFPQKTTKTKKDSTEKETEISFESVTAGYLVSDSNYIRNIYGEGEIWKGSFTDGTLINSLLYRRKDNDEEISIYQLGISQKEYLELENNAKTVDVTNNPNPINFFFELEEDATFVSSSVFKYKLRLKFEKKDGTRAVTTISKSLYTIDGYFFFTKEYSDKFAYFSEFAKISVDFRPRNDWMQYYKYKNVGSSSNPIYVTDGLYNEPNVFYGFDWLKKGDSERNGIYRISDEHYLNSFFLTIGENLSSDPNNGINVTPQKKKYIDVKKIYKVIPLSWKLSNGELFDNQENFTNLEPDDTFDKDYAPSWITIPHIEDNTIQLLKLRLKIRCAHKPISLKLYFNASNFKINRIGIINNPVIKQDENYLDNKLSYIEINSTDVPANNKIKWIDFEFETINTYGKLEIFKVLADKKLAGLLYLMPNNTDNIRYKKLLTIKIKHNNTTAGTGQITEDEIKMLKIFSSHANIKLRIEEYNGGVLDLSSDSVFQQYFEGGKVNRDKIVQGKNIYQYLLSLISGYQDYVKIFSINAGAKSFGLGGFTLEDMKVVIMFNSPTEGASPNIYHLAHEYLHSVGVAHTFTDQLTDENAFLTFVQERTNNVMDYSNDDIALHQFVQGTFFWQWAIARQNSSKNF